MASDIQKGFGHQGAIRDDNRQAVRPRWSETWDVFENGRCIATGLSETAARGMIKES